LVFFENLRRQVASIAEVKILVKLAIPHNLFPQILTGPKIPRQLRNVGSQPFCKLLISLMFLNCPQKLVDCPFAARQGDFLRGLKEKFELCVFFLINHGGNYCIVKVLLELAELVLPARGSVHQICQVAIGVVSHQLVPFFFHDTLQKPHGLFRVLSGACIAIFFNGVIWEMSVL
jgi:hypothetical protein